MYVFSKLSQSFRFYNQNPVNISFLHMRAKLPVHVILLDHITLIIYTLRAVKTMQLLIV